MALPKERTAPRLEASSTAVITMLAIPARWRLVAAGVLVMLLVHFSAVQLSPESVYAQRTSVWRYMGSNGTLGDERKAVEGLYSDGALVQGTGNSSSTSSGSAKQRRAKATFVILARNSDLWSIMESIRFMEDRFNRKYKSVLVSSLGFPQGLYS